MWFTMCCFTRNWSLSMLFNHSDSECDSLCPALLGIGVFLCCSINQITRIQNVIHGGFRMWFTMCCFTRNLSLFVLFNSANSECDSLGAALLGIGVFSCCSITRIQNVIRGRFGMCFTRLNNTSSGAVWSKEPPPPGRPPIYYVPSSRTVSKRTPLEEFVPGALRGVLLLMVFEEGT